MGAPKKSERPRIVRGKQLIDMVDGSVVVDPRAERVHVMNPAAAFIMSLCDGEHSVDDLARELREAVPALSVDQAAADVGAALDEFRSLGLLAEGVTAG